MQQSHAQLQGPEDYLQSDNTIPVGPGDVLPKKRNVGSSGVASYEGWDYVEAPKGGPDSVRQNIADDLDEVLRVACILKPAGMVAGTTVAQSGLSKAYDSRDSNSTLAEIAHTLQEAEEAVAGFVQDCAGVKGDAEIEYPSEFDLTAPADVAAVLADVQALAGQIGLLPETETEILQRVVSTLLPGISEDRLGVLHGEIADAAQAGAARVRESSAYPGGDGGGELGQDGAEPRGGTGQNSTQDPSIVLPPDASAAIQALGSVLSPDFA